MTPPRKTTDGPDELAAARENLDYARREYNAERIGLRVLDMARDRLARAEAAAATPTAAELAAAIRAIDDADGSIGFGKREALQAALALAEQVQA